MIVFDAHCDTLSRPWAGEGDIFAANPRGHWDLPRSKTFVHTAQFFAIFADSRGKSPAELAKIFATQYTVFQTAMQEHAGEISHCRTARQMHEAFAAGRVAAFLSVEGAELLACSIAGLEMAQRAGLRAVNLTWNRANALSGSCMEERERGLSAQGRAFVQRAQELGVLLDCSHLSDPGFWDLLELASAPVIASHSNARALCPHPRNLTDAQFAALIQNGGVAGLNLYAAFLGEKADLDTVRAHLEHLWALGGEESIALGGDWDGCDCLPSGMEDGFSALATLYENLLRKNYGESLLDKLYHQNMTRVVNQVCVT